jgi:hypothetical protein
MGTRTDEIVSQATQNSSRDLILLSALVLVWRVSSELNPVIELPGGINVSGRLVLGLAACSLLYAVVVHMSNWLNDKEGPGLFEPRLFNLDTYFGDHPASYDGTKKLHIGRLRNLVIMLRGEFGFSPWTAPAFLFYGVHLLLPMLAWIAATMVLAIY